MIDTLTTTHPQAGNDDSQAEVTAKAASSNRLQASQRDGRHSSRQCKDAFDEFMQFLFLRPLAAHAPAP